MNEEPFYSLGLRFSCTRCSSCCRKESGFVYLAESDLSRLANAFQLNYTDFISAWCRWVPFFEGRERLSLREKSNMDCIFWKDGCTVYQARPLQCRSFPFWDSVLASPKAWEATGKECPGVNSGDLHDREEIAGFLRQLEEEVVIERDMLRFGGR